MKVGVHASCVSRTTAAIPAALTDHVNVSAVVQRCGIVKATPWVPNISGRARATVKPLVDVPETPRAVAEGMTSWPSELFDPFGAECLIADLRGMMQGSRGDLKA